MPNPYRGEVEITLGGQCYILRPTFQALAEIEQATGKSLLILISQFEEKGLLLEEQIAILSAGIRAGGGVPGGIFPDTNTLRTQLYEAGIMKVLPVLMQFLHGAVR